MPLDRSRSKENKLHGISIQWRMLADEAPFHRDDADYAW